MINIQFKIHFKDKIYIKNTDNYNINNFSRIFSKKTYEVN